MRKPGIGRIVFYWEPGGLDPKPAMIVKVWSETCVNLVVFSDSAAPEIKTSVSMADTSVLSGSGWGWPPITQ